MKHIVNWISIFGTTLVTIQMLYISNALVAKVLKEIPMEF